MYTFFYLCLQPKFNLIDIYVRSENLVGVRFFCPRVYTEDCKVSEYSKEICTLIFHKRKIMRYLSNLTNLQEIKLLNFWIKFNSNSNNNYTMYMKDQQSRKLDKATATRGITLMDLFHSE